MPRGEAAPPLRHRAELRRYQHGAVVLVVLGLALGVALLPAGDELLLIHVKNRDVSRARAVLADATRQSVSTAASVVAHNELYLMEGRVDDALSELEAFADAHPGNADAWKRLARTYADAQRMDDQVRATAHVYRLEPSADLARRLVRLHRWSGDEAAESTLLDELVVSGRATIEEHLRAARLAAALGRPDRALGALERLRLQTPGAFDYPALELYATLLVEEEGPSRLGLRIGTLPLVKLEPDVLAALAQTLKGWGRPDAAVALFQLPDGVEAGPAQRAMQARVAAGTSEAPRIAHELTGLDARRPLGAEPLAALVDLLLSLGDYETVAAVIANPARTADPTLAGLAIGHAVANGHRDRAQSLIAGLGDIGLADSPVLALDLAVERQDVAAAQHWIEALDQAGPTPEQAGAIAQFESRLGQPERAFERLAALVRAGEAPIWSLGDFAGLAVSLGRVDDALPLLSASRSPGASGAWARLAAADGRTALLVEWLSSAGRDAEADTLRDVYYLLADRGHIEPAALAAERLFDRQGTNANALLLGQALLAAGRPADALEPLRQTGPEDAEASRTYDVALVASLHAGADVAVEARRVLGRRLQDPHVPADHRPLLVEGLWMAGERASLFDEVRRLAEEDLDRWLPWLVESARAAGKAERAVMQIAARLDPAIDEGGGDGAALPDDARTTLVRALMELDASDAVLLPQLQRLAYNVGDSWVYAYDERLTAGARTTERVALWTAVGRSSTEPADTRRSAAARLVELGATVEAAGVFELIAANAGPDDEDLRQLLWLWGPAASDREISWLLSRLHTASAGDEPLWMAHIVRAGGARRIASAMPLLPANASPALVEAWISAYEAVADRALLQDALQQVLLRPASTTPDLRAAGRTALAHELPEVAANAFTLLVVREPEDQESLRWLGALAFYDGRAVVARTWLERYIEAGGDEPEAFYQLGELALTNSDPDGARRSFERALLALDARPASRTNQVLRANTLVRLDERAGAAAAFEAVLGEDPGLDHVRADYVAALLLWGDYTRARVLLDGRPRVGASGDSHRADTSGDRRLELLQAQWLIHAGQYRDALQVLEALAARFPSDPDVLLARARFDEERGRPAAAALDYERARRSAPQRDDIERLLQDRTRAQSPRAGIETEVRSISQGWDEQYHRVTALGRLAPESPVTVTVERLRLDARLVRRANGQVGPLATTLTRFDANATTRVAPGTVVGGSLFGTAGGAGWGVRVAHDDLRGRWEVLVEAGRPFWEFLESAADDGRRDRVGAQRQWRFRPDTAAWAYGAWHRYRLGSGASTDSAALTLGLVRTVRQARPTVTLQYGLDKETRLDGTVATSPDGGLFMPVPLVSREVHLFGAISRVVIGDGWEVEGTGGYTLDRLGGRGSFFTARLAPPATALVGVELWADQRLFTLATSQRVFRAGARIRVRF